MLPVAAALMEAGHSVRFGVMGNDLDIRNDPRLRLLPSKPLIIKLRSPLAHLRCSLFLNGARCLVMDWVKLRTLQTRSLTEIARKRGIPSVALPHSVDIVQDAEYFSGRLNEGIFSHFDWVVVPNYIRKEALEKAGFDPQRIAVLGNMRFTQNWSTRLRGVYPPKPKSADERTRIVFFDVPIPQRYDPTIAALRRLSALPGVELAIQSKPVAQAMNSPRALSSLFPNLADQSHPGQLCNWADIVIGVSSSVMVEAITQGRHLIWPRYLDPDSMVFADTQACWVADSENELMALVANITAGKLSAPPDRSTFVRHIICGDRDENDVAPGYVEFLSAVAGRGSSSVDFNSRAA